MSILDQFGNPVSSGSRHFATGADRNDRAFPQQPLFKDDFDKLIPDYDRQFIVSASRKLFQNYGPIRGAIVQKANNVVGRAWEPKFQGVDAAWGKMATEWLVDQWYGNCDVKGRAWDFKTQLWLDSVAIDRDGDFLIYLTEGESGYPLTQRISVNRIGQRNGAKLVADGNYKGLKISHGVILSKLNRAVAYQILGDTAAEDKIIPSSSCIHVFDPQWHDQTRGIPSFDGAIKTAFGSMTATEREQLNQNIRSSIAIIEYNETGGPDMDDPANQLGASGEGGAMTGPTIENYAGGSIKHIRSNSGGKMEALDNDMPGDSWDRFQNRAVRYALTYFDWPMELVWEAQVNAALVRHLQERARVSVEDRQDVLRSPALFQIRYAIAKAIKSGIIDAPPKSSASDWWRWDFGMPRKFSIDYGKEAAQRRDDYRIGFRSRSDVAAEDGKSAEEIEDEKIEDAFRFEKKIRDREAKEKFTIDRRQLVMMTPNEMAPDASAEPELDEDGNLVEANTDDGGAERMKFDNLKAKFDAYGVAVRAGAITPADADEQQFRSEAGLPPMTSAVKGAWKEDKGFRRPITLAPPGGAAAGGMFGGGSKKSTDQEDEE